MTIRKELKLLLLGNAAVISVKISCKLGFIISKRTLLCFMVYLGR